jgi:hypothetical protein
MRFSASTGMRRPNALSLVTGEEVAALLKDSAAAPKEVIARVKQALGRY